VPKSVFGDFLNLDDVRAALRGVAGAYFATPSAGDHPGDGLLSPRPPKEAGIGGVVNMSQVSAREDAKSHASFDHWLAERVFDWSGLTVAHLRPTSFAEWLLYSRRMIRAGLYTCPSAPAGTPDCGRDQARVIVGILEDPASHRGKIYPLYGPGRVHPQGNRAVLSRVLGKDVSTSK